MMIYSYRNYISKSITSFNMKNVFFCAKLYFLKKGHSPKPDLAEFISKKNLYWMTAQNSNFTFSIFRWLSYCSTIVRKLLGSVKSFCYILVTRNSSTDLNTFAKVMKVTNFTGLWDAKLTWYSLSATHWICFCS